MKNLLLVLLILFITGCTKNKLEVDASEVKIKDFTIHRLEQDMFNMKPDSIKNYTPLMQKKYGKFYTRFVSNIINKGGTEDSSYSYNLSRFITDKDMREAFKQTQAIYADVNWLKKDLSSAFKYFKYYFAERPIPKVITFMSGFNYSIANTDSTLGVGLEMYLGSDNEFYKMVQFPKYKTNAMRKEYIVPDCIKGWMNTEFENKMNKADFLSEIVYRGKIMYLTEALLPETHDTLRFAYTGKQLEWCKENEGNVWSYFLEQKLLYSKDYTEIGKYISEGPFTSAFSKESPAGIGAWIGLQIVKKFMDKNDKVTVKELMEENDAQLILSRSKYKPRK